MLDPLTSLSIACNVMQIISFSLEVTSIVKRIKKDGTTDLGLRENAENLSASSKGLKKYLKGCDLKHLPKNQAKLQNIATKCLKTSKDIQSNMDEIDSTRGGPVMGALKLKWRKGVLERLEQDMRKYQDAMQTTILVHICNQNDAAALEQETRFENLNGSLQIFIKAYARGQAELQDLMSDQFWATRALINAATQATSQQIEEENHKTREYFSTTQATTESRRNHEAQRKQLLKSLYDQEMNARRNQIERSHSKTFSWIFNGELHRPWDSFTEWLSSKSSTYWICGKAGSGKSTLMKFLIDHERTREYLYEWAPDCSIYAHFIWNSGTRMQGSILGLLRSLLFQIFEANDHIVAFVLWEWPKLSKIRSPDDWSREDLEEILFRSLYLHKNGVCIFVDGLDEIDAKDGPFDLLSLVKRISTLPENKGLKVCVSSRPETSFKLGLDPFPKLRLQDLTKHDVEVYAKAFVQSKCSFDLSGIDESEFIEEIVTKANGVFLWVSLALKSLQRGVTNGDDPTKLMERLRKLPSELGKLYEEMLKRLGDDQDLYSEEAAMIFNLFILFSERANHNLPPKRWNLLQYAAAFDPALRDMLLKQESPPSPKSLKKFLLDVDPKLTSRCAGILEVVSHLKGQEDIEYILSRDTSRPWDAIGIEFLHRSAKDFLLSLKYKFLDQDPTSAAERKFRMLQAIVLDESYPRDKRSLDMNLAMEIMSYSEPSLSNEQEVQILNLIQEIYQRNGWREFYESAARYGLHQPLAHLLDDTPGDIGPLRSYLLLCAVSNYTQRTNTMVSHLLEMGAYSNNSVALAQMNTNSGRCIYFLMPLLGNFFATGLPSLSGNIPLIENMLHSFVGFGANLEEKFLSLELGLSRSFAIRYTNACRPSYCYSTLGSHSYDLVVETNCVNVILNDYLGRRNFSPAERSAVASRLGLDISRAHHQILLYFYQDTIYGADDEDSDTLNKILGWPESRMYEERSLTRSSKYADRIRERKDRFEKVRQVLKGKEVDDIEKWLADRGYVLAEQSDIEGISDQASVHEMAAIYQKLGEKYAQRRRK